MILMFIICIYRLWKNRKSLKKKDKVSIKEGGNMSVTYFKFDRYNNDALSKWLEQNKAELIDAYDGCLLDNVLYQCKNGVAAFYEQYVNPNESEYVVEFARDNDTKAMNEVKDKWYELQAEAETGYEEEEEMESQR